MIYHILKDGTRVDDITGHVVKMSDAEALYTLIDTITGTESSKEVKP